MEIPYHPRSEKMEMNHDSECFNKTASLMEIQHGYTASWNIFQMNLPESSTELAASHLWLRKGMFLLHLKWPSP